MIRVSPRPRPLSTPYVASTGPGASISGFGAQDRDRVSNSLRARLVSVPRRSRPQNGKTMANQPTTLTELFVELFSAEELRRWLAHVFGADVLENLPGESTPLIELAHRAELFLQRRKLLDRVFPALRKSRENCLSQIDSVERALTPIRSRSAIGDFGATMTCSPQIDSVDRALSPTISRSAIGAFGVSVVALILLAVAALELTCTGGATTPGASHELIPSQQPSPALATSPADPPSSPVTPAITTKSSVNAMSADEESRPVEVNIGSHNTVNAAQGSTVEISGIKVH